MTLTNEDVAHMRRPYHVNAVRWLPIGGITRNGSQQLLPHIDASLVIERLNDVDPGWTDVTEPMIPATDPNDPFGLRLYAPWQCRLIVKGVQRTGVGQLDATSSKLDGKTHKAAESDSLKRAALRFGIGGYLRALPQMYLPANVEGREAFWTREQGGKQKFGGLNPAGKAYLRAEYLKVVQHAAFVERHGEMIDYGDPFDESADVEPVAAPNDNMPPHQLAVLVLLSRYNGRDTDPGRVMLEYETKVFAKALPRVLNGAKAALACDDGDARRLFELAIAAGEDTQEGSGRLGELEEALDTLRAFADAERGAEGNETEATA